MRTISDYLKNVEHIILNSGGDRNIVEEYSSHLQAEFKDFKASSPTIPKDQDLEEIFVSNLEAPHVIAKSLIGPTETFKTKLLDLAHRVWRWYDNKILSKFLGFPFTIMSLWLFVPILILLFLVLNDWFHALMMDLFPRWRFIHDIWWLSLRRILEFQAHFMQSFLLYVFMVIFLTLRYSLNKKIALTIILSAWALMTGSILTFFIRGNIPTSSFEYLTGYLFAICILITIGLVLSLIIHIALGVKFYKKRKGYSL